MKSFPARTIRLVLALLLVLGSNGAQAEIQRLLLVTATPELEGLQLSRKDISRLYLSKPLYHAGLRLVPLINLSDPLAHEVFLQKVMLMSARSYDRLLLSRVFRRGGTRPERFHSLLRLIETLQEHPGSITYMWQHEAVRYPRLTTLMELWQGNVR